MKKGFSLTELIVVMSLMAIVSGLGIAGIMAFSNVSNLDKASEELVVAIREAQTRSTSVSTDETGSTIPIVWGVNISSSPRAIDAFNLKDSSASGYKTFPGVEFGSFRNITSIKLFSEDSGGARTEIPSVYLYYTTPYGQFFNTVNNCSDGVACIWYQETNRPRDFKISYITPNILTGKNVVIELTHRGNKKEVIITSGGDVYAK